MNFSISNKQLVKWAIVGVVISMTSGMANAKEIVIEERDSKYYQGTQEVTGNTLSASVGDTLKVVNNDNVMHNVTVTEGSSTLYNQNQKPKNEGGTDVIIPLKTAGTVNLKCTIHPNMELNFTVK